MKTERIIVLLCLLTAVAARALALPAVSTGFVHYGVENGLSNNYVTDIIHDNRGRIWVATENGLNMFDGYWFMSFTSYNSGLKHNTINALYYDAAEDRLWVGAKYGRLCSLDCSSMSFSDATPEEKAPRGPVVAFAPRRGGGFWVVPGWGGLYCYDTAVHHFVKVKVKGMNDAQEFSCAMDDGEGHLYVGTVYGGLYVVDLRRMTAVNMRNDGTEGCLPSDRVYAICRDHTGNIWIGTNNGLALMSGRKGRFKVFRHVRGNDSSIMSDHIYDIMETHDGFLLVGSDIGGVSIVDLRQAVMDGLAAVRFTNIKAGPHSGDLSSNSIRSFDQDEYGNIWVGNYGGGIDMKEHLQASFATVRYLYDGSERYKPVWGTCTDSFGRLWAGGMNEIVMIENNTVVERVDITRALGHPYGQVVAMCEEPRGGGGLLLGVFDDGLLRYDLRTGAVSRIRLGKPNTDVYTMLAEDDGSVLVGTEDGLYRYRDGRAVRLDSYMRQMTEPFIYGIVRDRQHKLWLGTYSGGVFVFAPSGQLLCRMQTEQGMPTNGINSLFLDSRGRVWAASRMGLIEFGDTRRPRRFTVHGYGEGLTDCFVRSVAEDATGDIWLSTNNGISMWNRRSRRFSNYGLKDGLPAGNFIEGSALRTRRGMMVFGSLGGVCMFSPQAVLARRLGVPVQIAVCKRLTEQQGGQTAEAIVPMEKGRVSLSHDQNSFTVSFFVPDFSLSRYVDYAVKVEGLDDQWTSTMGENHITLRNLPYGHYRLKVKARLRNQPWNEAGAAVLDIEIRPPLWLSWPMKTLYLILIAGLSVGALRRYARHIKARAEEEATRRRMESEQELNEERLRFYTNITHELRTPLTLILGPLEDLTNDAALPPRLKDRVNGIFRSAARLLELVNRLLDFRKTETNNRRLTVEHGDISTLVTETGLRYKEMNRNRNVEITVCIDTADTVLWFDREVIRTILDNLMSNAMKYTPQGKISLMVTGTSDDEGRRCTQIAVKDTGYGIAAEALPHIFERFYQADGRHQASGTGIGLAIVKAMADLHRATLKAESTPGRGTTFTLTLRNDNTYPEALHKDAGTTQPLQTPRSLPDSTIGTQDEDRKIMLIVEDNDDIRRYIADAFRDEYAILEASNGKDGWEKARAGVPDIIISDIMMPVMDGLELCRLVKNDISTSHIPVILLTAKDTLTDKEAGYDTGADSYIVKPFSAKLLHSRVRNLLEARRRMARTIAERTSNPRNATGDMTAAGGQEKTIEGLNRVSTAFMKRFEEIVEQNVSNDKLDLQFMAAELGMSLSSLYRKVKSLTGMTGNELIRKIRLRHALQLMLGGEANISTAAYGSGFNDLPYFRQCFKKEYGLTPKEYLERH